MGPLLPARILLVTGPPGSGKTTLIQHIYDHYSKLGVSVVGIITREYRVGEERAGFKLRNLGTGEEGWLARKQGGSGPKIGQYNVDSKDLERIGVAALLNAMRENARLVLVDEIGPMEMTSRAFRTAISQLLASGKATVATLRHDSRYPEVEEARRTVDTRTILVTLANRENIPQEIVAEVDAMLGLTGGGPS